MFQPTMIADMAKEPATSAATALFFVLLNLYIKPATNTKEPVAITCIKIR